MLPGNGTVVLESIANVHAGTEYSFFLFCIVSNKHFLNDIFTALQTYTLNEHSSAIISATTQVYLSLGKLIKLCDEVLLSENEENCASLSNENVTEVVDLVDTAIIVSKNNIACSINKRCWEEHKRRKIMGILNANKMLCGGQI